MGTTGTRKPLGTQAHTGEVCPESGVWKSLDSPSTTAPIAKGNRMPPHNGRGRQPGNSSATPDRLPAAATRPSPARGGDVPSSAEDLTLRCFHNSISKVVPRTWPQRLHK